MMNTIGVIIIGALLIVATILNIVHQRKKRRIISQVTSLERGEESEHDLIYRLIQGGIPSTTIFHDLYMPTKSGHTQIDLVVPTSVGIFVFEVKDYSGWIFGNGYHDKWTQVLARGREKHQFYNPIRQNDGHIKAIRNSSEQLQNVPIFSIVVFYGSSVIKELSNTPYNCWVVYPDSVIPLIRNIMNGSQPAPYTDKWEVMRILKSAVNNGNDASIRYAHMQKAQRASYGKYKSTYRYFPHFYIPRLRIRGRRMRF